LKKTIILLVFVVGMFVGCNNNTETNKELAKAKEDNANMEKELKESKQREEGLRSAASRNQYKQQASSKKQVKYISPADSKIIAEAKTCKALGNKMQQCRFPSYEYGSVRDNEYMPALRKFADSEKKYITIYGVEKYQALAAENDFPVIKDNR